MNADHQIDRNINRHNAADHRWLVKMERLEAAAEPLIGELCREGKTIYYINTVKGTREGTKAELVDFLARNNYI